MDRPWNSPGQNTGVGSCCLHQGIFPTQRLNPGLPHCRQILYQLSHQGSPRILEWVAYPFSSGSSPPGIKPGSPALQADSLPAEPPYSHYGAVITHCPPPELFIIPDWNFVPVKLEYPLEKGMASHSGILAWKIPWTEEPGGLQSMGSQRVRHDWRDLAPMCVFC